MDIEIQEMCFKHAQGDPVTITRGGNRIRLRAVMPNGGVTLVTYDTRVTSRVCGRVVYVHSDNTEVCYTKNGWVLFIDGTTFLLFLLPLSYNISSAVSYNSIEY